jgi:hypothetical protein
MSAGKEEKKRMVGERADTKKRMQKKRTEKEKDKKV